ncbi:MAG: hypothetical protein HETSPECPRED_003626 [Heterodermia speciosa]|uniref:Uncharacterized protein n=1 Tax=Heterodermia speciosa TaxID=116794 RepID=A0A8H3F4D0_9LECA|nr:MAG: hypothetical protein HETSPECPRED_003626 [Heterodermia speciosa]
MDSTYNFQEEAGSYILYVRDKLSPYELDSTPYVRGSTPPYDLEELNALYADEDENENVSMTVSGTNAQSTVHGANSESMVPGANAESGIMISEDDLMEVFDFEAEVDKAADVSGEAAHGLPSKAASPPTTQQQAITPRFVDPGVAPSPHSPFPPHPYLQSLPPSPYLQNRPAETSQPAGHHPPYPHSPHPSFSKQNRALSAHPSAPQAYHPAPHPGFINPHYPDPTPQHPTLPILNRHPSSTDSLHVFPPTPTGATTPHPILPSNHFASPSPNYMAGQHALATPVQRPPPGPVRTPTLDRLSPSASALDLTLPTPTAQALTSAAKRRGRPRKVVEMDEAPAVGEGKPKPKRVYRRRVKVTNEEGGKGGGKEGGKE